MTIPANDERLSGGPSSTGIGRTPEDAGIAFVDVVQADRAEFERALFTHGYPRESAAALVATLPATDAGLQMLARHRIRYTTPRVVPFGTHPDPHDMGVASMSEAMHGSSEARPTITSRELIRRCGGDPDAPFEVGPFPAEMRERIAAPADRVAELEGHVAYLERDRLAISAERNEAQEEVRQLKAQLMAGLPAQARMAATSAAAMQVRALLRPANVEGLLERHPDSLTGAEAAEIALWAQAIQGRALRFVAELATMTDVEADFLDGHEVRLIASLLQVPDDDGHVAPTLPRLYTENDRDRARAVLFERYHNGDKPPVQQVATTTGEVVDLVAEALGMRRAGA